MAWVRIPNAGSVGVNKDLSTHELPINAWTDASNIRFLNGYVYQFYGHGEVYNSPSFAPQHVLPVNVGGSRYWIYLTADKAFAVVNSGGVAVHTDITHATPRTGVVNQWTSTLLSGIPVVNSGDTTHVPMTWDQNLANDFVDLPNWPANTYCKSLRAYKNYLVALNITKTTTNYPYMVKWSHPADPGSVPASWDHTDATRDAGEFDLAEGYDHIIDGLSLGDSFIIYKESSCWRMDFTGGLYVFSFKKLLGTSGAMNRNCIAELDGFHVVLTGSDVVIIDGFSKPISILDRQTRRYLFQNIDVDGTDLCFVFKNPFFNEIFICYPSIGSSSCDRAVVWNYVDRTVSFRSLPNVNHAAFGPVDNTLAGNWNQDPAPWASDLSLWDGPDFVPDTARVIMGSNNTKLYMMDASASFDGSLPSAYVERRGLSFGEPERMKLIRGIRPRIVGNTGDTVIIKIGYSNDPYDEPTWVEARNFTIGQNLAANCMVSGRYIAIRFETGTAYQWRLDSFDIDVVPSGSW
jgi:hypothetical protein